MGIDPETGKIVLEFRRKEADFLINLKELLAATNTVQSLARPKSNILLKVDNAVTFWYLVKGGGKKNHFNNILRPFLTWCQEKQVTVQLELVASKDMLADKYSRWGLDHGDYTLHPDIFQKICQLFQQKVSPQIDLFASPGNSQLPQFVSRWPHHQAIATDAMRCNLKNWGDVYANPPWKLILPWLCRLKENKNLTCLTILPLWVSATWWPLAVKLQDPKSPILVLPPKRGTFSNCFGEQMPPTRWPLACLILSGKFYKHNKFRVKFQIIS